MKFIDQKYIAFRNVDKLDIYNITNIPIYQLGFPSSYDDISINLSIDQKDNSLDIVFDEETQEYTLNDITIEEKNALLLEIKNELLKHPYLGDYYELIFENKI